MSRSAMSYYGNVRSAPQWRGDFGGREHILPTPAKILASAFADAAGIRVVASAQALANATSISVTALTPSAFANTVLIAEGNVLLRAGETLHFGGKKFATLTADAEIGDTSLAVSAIPTQIESGDVAVFSKFGTLSIASGTAIGRTYAERDAGTAFGPADVNDDEIYLTYNEVVDAYTNNDVELYRHRSLVKENYLPDYSTLGTPGDEVQTVTISGTLSGGSFNVTDGKKVSSNIAYNANTAAIQTGYDSVYGASQVVIAGTVGSHTVTFSGANVDDTDQPLVEIDGGNLTGFTGASVVQTTQGGTGVLTRLRELYDCIKGVD
jgi:hypothetical protein